MMHVYLIVVIFPGEFGVVYRGLLKCYFSDTIGDTVAVKTLRGSYETELFLNLRESIIMAILSIPRP